jgi:hypothetical protein
MSHRAAMYRVSVHPLYKRKELKRFGNLDGNGAKLASILHGYLEAGFSIDEGDRSVEAVKSRLTGDEVEVVFKHGRSGEAADIYDRERKKLLHQSPEDWHDVTTGALFAVPRNETEGWLAVHVQGNRSPKQLVYNDLSLKFRHDHDPLKLVVSPAVSVAVLKAAVEADRITQVKLTAIDRPTDIAGRLSKKWVRSNGRGRTEVTFRGGRGEYLLNNLILQYLNGNRTVQGKILEFSGAQFDNAQVEVELDTGQTRTFNIENPEAGHAFTVELENLTFNGQGEPTSNTLFAELRRAIEEMG